VYEYNTEGSIDLTRRSASGSVFGWDDIFVLDCGLSYHQLRQYGIKRSSRDMVISDFLRDNVYYKNLLDVEFNKQSPTRVIDFSVNVSEFVKNNKYYNNDLARSYGYRNLQNHVLNFGVFFRAAKNRRQNNYWNPGLNGGIPLTKKKDEIHEITFMAHDFGHFAIPDLIFIGNNSVRHRKAYIAWRMASEATTMALADMLFVDSLNKTGVQYDFNARRIYPLFLDLNIDFLDRSHYVANLKKVIRANFDYCLTGDSNKYRELIGSRSDLNLKKFEEKFMPFFVEDFNWTEHNYDNMQKRSEEMKRWWESILPIRKLSYLNIKSIDDFLGDLSNVDEELFIDQVFEIIFEQKVRPVLETEAELLPENQRLQRAFTRYMAGQMAIFSKFHFLAESKEYHNKILTLLLQHESSMDLSTINHIRSVYEEYLSLLVTKNLLSKDDQLTFSELYPLFDPHYVSYDQSLESYEDLKEVSKRIFALETHREKQLEQVARLLDRPLIESEKNYLSSISILVEESGGQIQDGLFVVTPGVMILSKCDLAERDNLVTFLISGISIETSLELIAHKEARVARLTTSKTNAMNIPLFRVHGNDTWSQKKYIEEILRYRGTFDRNFDSRKKWENEVWNMSMPGSKVTALCYSMTLKDFHSLFIGRMGPNGNEKEVREVVRLMANQLHSAYPQYINEADSYLEFSNAEKYKPQNNQITTPTKTSQLTWLADSQVTKKGIQLFRKLNINVEQGDYLSLCEFRSRITYLAFPKKRETAEEAKEYMRKMIEEFNHLSVVAAVQVVVSVPEKISEDLRSLFAKFGVFSNSTLVVSLKDLYQLFIQWKSLNVDPELRESFTKLAHSKFPTVIRSL
jgi:hypothetical protein